MMISSIDGNTHAYGNLDGGNSTGETSGTSATSGTGITGTTGASGTTSTTSTADGAVSILPDPVHQLACGGDLLGELVALLTLASQSDRNSARQAERAEDMLRTQQEHKKVEEMHAQADDIRAGAWAQGIAEIGQGVCEIGVGTTNAQAGKLDRNDVFKALDKAFAAAGTSVSGQYKADEKLDQANAEEAGANADRAGRGAKEASEDVEAARDMLKKIISFYDQMLQAQNASMQASVSWRA